MKLHLLLSIALTFLHGVVAERTTILISNVERGGRHFACPGQEVVLTCTGTETNFLNWISDSFATITYSSGDQEGLQQNRNSFVSNLTEAIPKLTIGTMESTLTFPAAVNEVVVQCTTLGNPVGTANATVEMEDPPFTPQSPQLSVSGYGVGGATVTVEWMYPDDGPVADNYTVSLSVGEPVTTTELMAIIEVVPYDQPLSASVLATNCAGNGSPAIVEVPCGIPHPPDNGSIVDFMVTEVVYRCNAGFGPNVEMTATCEEGSWSTAPSADLVCTPSSTDGEMSLSSSAPYSSTVMVTQPSLQTLIPSSTPTQTPSSDITLDMCTDGSSSDCTVPLVVTAIVSFVIIGSATGAVVLYCTVSKQSDSNCRPCPKSPENQYQDPPPGPMYETVSAPTQTGRENIELKENLAYGPVGN